MPESVKWYSLCSHIRELEDGADGLGPSFLDEVRTRWIRSMAQGMKTTNRNRAAVQEFRGRSRKIWGIPEAVSDLSAFHDHYEHEEGLNDQNEDEHTSNLAEIAQLNISLLQAEADCDASHLKQDVVCFLEKTECSLLELMDNGDENPLNWNDRMSPNGDGISVIHAHVEMEALAEEVLDRLKSGNQDEEIDQDFDQYLHEGQAVQDKQQSTADVDPSRLNSQQKSIYDRILKYLVTKKNALDGRVVEPMPLQYLIHGGPGNY